MAKVEIEDRERREFAERLMGLCRDEKIKLSTAGENLLRLVADAWLAEPPRFRTDVKLKDTAEQIIRQAARESHVREARRLGKEVPIHVWLYVLGSVGMHEIGAILEKGL